VKGNFDNEKVVPAIKLQIFLDLVPEYLSRQDKYMASGANWAYVARSNDNRIILAASDHLSKGCHINIFEYQQDGDNPSFICSIILTLPAKRSLSVPESHNSQEFLHA